ncbi:MAG TPA: N(4)-(beta-N-acetylglucosaminyl)-L-asparaginase [Bryobacteraceae bacterium]|nr:N(4)-(beta-N-acetylglucosaminyl)-L-asparaginase [Bryobacteraceae bacterium]
MRRRDWILSGAALPVSAAALQTAAAKNIVISSANGLQACAKAMEIIKGGGDTLDAVVAGVNIVEEDPNDTSVGYGGLPNEQGVVELDASVMHGPTNRAGAVSAIRNIKCPSKVAKLVLEQTDHVMLTGQGALDWAKAMGFKEENLLTERARLAWVAWKQSQRDGNGSNNWTDGLDAPSQPAGPKAEARLQELFPQFDDEMIAWALHMAKHPPTGTINCLALNSKGEMSGVTTTSGLAWKIPGRVGDSPIIGAGLFVDQEVGAAGSTGRGEENIRVVGAHTIVENMRHGMSPKDACLDCLKRIVRNFRGDREKLNRFDINFYALRKDGAYAGAALWSGRPRPGGGFTSPKFAVNTGATSRLEDCVPLMERRAPGR